MVQIHHFTTNFGKLFFILIPSISSFPIRTNKYHIRTKFFYRSYFIHIYLRDNLIHITNSFNYGHTLLFIDYRVLMLTFITKFISCNTYYECLTLLLCTT